MTHAHHLRRLRQDHGFEISLGYITMSCLPQLKKGEKEGRKDRKSDCSNGKNEKSQILNANEPMSEHHGALGDPKMAHTIRNRGEKPSGRRHGWN